MAEYQARLLLIALCSSYAAGAPQRTSANGVGCRPRRLKEELKVSRRATMSAGVGVSQDQAAELIATLQQEQELLSAQNDMLNTETRTLRMHLSDLQLAFQKSKDEHQHDLERTQEAFRAAEFQRLEEQRRSQEAGRMERERWVKEKCQIQVRCSRYAGVALPRCEVRASECSMIRQPADLADSAYGGAVGQPAVGFESGRRSAHGQRRHTAPSYAAAGAFAAFASGGTRGGLDIWPQRGERRDPPVPRLRRSRSSNKRMSA